MKTGWSNQEIGKHMLWYHSYLSKIWQRRPPI